MLINQSKLIQGKKNDEQKYMFAAAENLKTTTLLFLSR